MIQSGPTGIVIEREISFDRKQRRKRIVPRKAASTSMMDDMPSEFRGRIPRIARLVALALRFDQLVRDGEVKSFAQIARLGHVTRARVTQIMNLLNLAPDIIDEILHLPPVVRGRDPIRENQLRPIAAEPDWTRQRAMWAVVKEDRS